VLTEGRNGLARVYVTLSGSRLPTVVGALFVRPQPPQTCARHRTMVAVMGLPPGGCIRIIDFAPAREAARAGTCELGLRLATTLVAGCQAQLFFAILRQALRTMAKPTGPGCSTIALSHVAFFMSPAVDRGSRRGKSTAKWNSDGQVTPRKVRSAPLG